MAYPKRGQYPSAAKQDCLKCSITLGKTLAAVSRDDVKSYLTLGALELAFSQGGRLAKSPSPQSGRKARSNLLTIEDA
jgi:hypothetical protein